MAGKLTKLSSRASIEGVKYIGDYNFRCGDSSPIFEVSTQHGLNQLLGNAKFNNREYGEVLYRGQCNLYDTVMPSLFRKCKLVHGKMKALNSLIQSVKDDEPLCKDLKINGNPDSEAIIEAALQHYGVPTRYIDLVDNHWVALWMGLYHAQKAKRIIDYYHYEKRTVLVEKLVNGDYKGNKLDDLYQFILLIAVPSLMGKEGVKKTDGFLQIDLRQALPSIFLRPHAQHGIVVRRKGDDSGKPSFYDVASQVVGVLKIRIDIADKWLGNGTLLTMENLFPPAAVDYWYDLLLSKTHIFNKPDCTVTRYY